MRFHVNNLWLKFSHLPVWQICVEIKMMSPLRKAVAKNYIKKNTDIPVGAKLISLFPGWVEMAVEPGNLYRNLLLENLFFLLNFHSWLLLFLLFYLNRDLIKFLDSFSAQIDKAMLSRPKAGSTWWRRTVCPGPLLPLRVWYHNLRKVSKVISAAEHNMELACFCYSSGHFIAVTFHFLI